MKKTISIFLSLAVLFAVLSAGGVTSFAAGETLSGNGTESEPYLVADAADLEAFRDLVNGGQTGICAVLTADIELNPGVLSADANGNPLYNGAAVGEANQPKAWTPIGNNSNRYAGVFDGGGHTVSGLCIDSADREQGLFGVSAGTIQNTGVVNAYVRGSDRVGGVCGLNSGTIANCYNAGAVTGTTMVGGVCGATLGTVTGCYNTGTVSGSESVGGVCGNGGVGDKPAIENCYNTGTVTGNSYVGGVCGADAYGNTIKNCYYLSNEEMETDTYEGTTVKTAAQFSSGEVAYLLNGQTTGEANRWFQTLGRDQFPVLDPFAESVYYSAGSGGYYSLPSRGRTSVAYTVAPAYTVTIPETVELGGPAEIKAENVRVEKGQQVVVKLTGTNGEADAFTVKTEQGAVLGYEITSESPPGKVGIGATVLTVDPSKTSEGSVTLSFNAPAGVKFSGTYTGTVTFTVSVEPATP